MDFEEIVVSDALKLIEEDNADIDQEQSDDVECDSADQDVHIHDAPANTVNAEKITIAGLPPTFKLGKIWEFATPQAKATAIECAEMILKALTHSNPESDGFTVESIYC